VRVVLGRVAEVVGEARAAEAEQPRGLRGGAASGEEFADVPEALKVTQAFVSFHLASPMASSVSEPGEDDEFEPGIPEGVHEGPVSKLTDPHAGSGLRARGT
jgi:hypothetical protein